MTLPRNANRWRQRFQTIETSTSSMATTNIVQPVATRSTPRSRGEPGRPKVGERPQHGGIGASVTRCTHARWIDASSQATTTALVSSQT